VSWLFSVICHDRFLATGMILYEPHLCWLI